jgi:hypothetical protein
MRIMSISLTKVRKGASRPLGTLPFLLIVARIFFSIMMLLCEFRLFPRSRRGLRASDDIFGSFFVNVGTM